MKKTVFTFAVIGFVIFWFLMGFRVWPFLSWFTGIVPWVLPTMLLVFFCIGYEIHLVKIMSKVVALNFIDYCFLLFPPIAIFFGLLSLFKLNKIKYKYHLLWFPFIFTNALWVMFFWGGFYFSSFKYDGNYSIGHSYLVGKIFIINQYGNILFHTSGNCHIRDTENGLLLVEENEKIGLYSLEMDEYIVPLGHSLKVSTQIYKEGDYYGLIAKNGYVLLPPIYEYIDFITPNNLKIGTEKGLLLCTPLTYTNPVKNLGVDNREYRSRLINTLKFEKISLVSSSTKDGDKTDDYYIELKHKNKRLLYRVRYDYEWDDVWNNYEYKEYYPNHVYESGEELRIEVKNSFDKILINEKEEELFEAKYDIFWSSEQEVFKAENKGGIIRFYTWDGEFLREE